MRQRQIKPHLAAAKYADRQILRQWRDKKKKAPDEALSTFSGKPEVAVFSEHAIRAGESKAGVIKMEHDIVGISAHHQQRTISKAYRVIRVAGGIL